jgi:hypothetical protein
LSVALTQDHVNVTALGAELDGVIHERHQGALKGF